MAQDPKEEKAPEEAAPKSNKKLIIIIAGVLLLALAGGGAAWYFMGNKAGPKKEEKHDEAPKPPVFVTLESFTVNLQPDPDEKFLQVDLTLKVASPEVSEQVKLNMPEIRNRILLLLSNKKASEINNVEGKKTLSDEIVNQVKQPFNKGEKPLEVSGVFFTSFVIQ